MDRRVLIVGSVVALAGPLAARAQQLGKVYRVGVLTSTTHFTPAFRHGLRELG